MLRAVVAVLDRDNEGPQKHLQGVVDQVSYGEQGQSLFLQDLFPV